jgi:hypothetical protein
MNKKKVRGWKRQIRKLDKWKLRNLNLELNRYDYDYVKIWLDPWYRLEKCNPPIWFRRLIIAALLEIYGNWHKQLLKRGGKFYLKIWLFDPHFIDSQVVAAVGERIHYYEELFVKNTESRKFPYQKYFHGSYNLHDYNWDLHVDEDVSFERADELEADEIASLQRVATRTEKLPDGETIYAVKRGDLWLGTHK